MVSSALSLKERELCGLGKRPGRGQTAVTAALQALSCLRSLRSCPGHQDGALRAIPLDLRSPASTSLAGAKSLAFWLCPAGDTCLSSEAGPFRYHQTRHAFPICYFNKVLNMQLDYKHLSFSALCGFSAEGIQGGSTGPGRCGLSVKAAGPCRWHLGAADCHWRFCGKSKAGIEVSGKMRSHSSVNIT